MRGIMTKENEAAIFTIGYSTRTFDEFMELLTAFNVKLLVDVRSVPRSRHNTQFNKENLQITLKNLDVKYIHMPEIGGFRRSRADSVNTSWKNKSFRGYADFMQTKEFTEQLLRIIALPRENNLAVMCAEALPWRCHRSLIADALVVRNFIVKHIISKDTCINHTLSEWAQVHGTKITYPLFAKRLPQRVLSDFGTST